MTPHPSIKRLSLVVWSSFLVTAYVAGELFHIQILQHEHYLAEAERQHKQKIDLPPKRGDILDRHGNPLALSAEGLNVYAIPEKIKNKTEAARILASHLNLPENNLLQRISSPRPYIWLQQKVNPLTLTGLEEINMDGIGFIPSPKRYYPRHSLAAQIIGFVGIDDRGLSGVEFTYNSHLQGEPGWLVVQRDAKGRPYNILDYPHRREINGRSLRLTIDAEFQEIVEEILRRAVEENGAKNGCVVAVNPRSGEILALANYPNVDLSADTGFQKSDFLNLATNMPFEPGSTFKTFAASALLARGYAKLEDSVFCENGIYNLNSRTIKDVHAFGKLSFKDVIVNSSNIGMAKLIRRIPNKELYCILRDFGFGSYTGSCFSGEDKGYLALPADWDGTTKTSLAMGYNIMATPLQMAMAYACIANGGLLYEPALVDEIFDEQGNVHYSFKPRVLRRVIPEDIARKLTREALIQVIESGTGKSAAVAGFRVAGKTGTSMKANPVSGYNGNGYISSFGGFFPAEDPQICMYIAINDPDFSHRFGGTCAAPVFSEIVRNTLLSASQVLDRSKLGLPETMMQTVSASSAPSPGKERHSPVQASIDLKTADSSGVIMPELSGLSIRKAAAVLNSLGLKAKVTGGIQVLEQSPRAGTLLPDGATCSITGFSTNRTNNSISLAAETGLTKEKKFPPNNP